MNLMMMLAACRSRTLKTQTFTSNTTWVAPATTSLLETLTGKGGTGTAAYTREGYSYVERNEAQGRLRSTGEWVVRSSTTGVGFSTSYPTDGCGPSVPTDDETYSAYRSCSYYSSISADTEVVPATTGGTTTGFGKTFVGGTGGAATPATHNAVAVTSGASYPLVIPTGGSITITYYE